MQELSAGWVWGSPHQGRGGTRSPAPALGNWKGPRASEGVLQNQPQKPQVWCRRRGAGSAHGQAPSTWDICSEDVRRVSEGYEMLHKFRCLEPCKRGAGCALTPSAAQEHLGLTRKSIPPPLSLATQQHLEVRAVLRRG